MRRHLIFLAGDDAYLTRQLQHNLPPLARAVWLGDRLPLLSSASHFPFSKSKNLLGREFPAIIYDARAGINLDALAIAAGALQAGGALLLLFNHWQDLALQPDTDSLRWSGEKQPIITPHFVRFLQAKVRQYGFPVYQNEDLKLPLRQQVNPPVDTKQPTPEQAHLLAQLTQSDAEILLISAKRGRGKSALAGLFAKQLRARKTRLMLTAPNKSAVKILNEFSGAEIDFMPPDELCRQIAHNPQQFAEHWLFIDEAAMIPLATLFRLTAAFKRVICTTTVHSYEGTGRGFLLKFIAKIDRTLQQFALFTPLRWQPDDPLEGFIDELLLCESEDRLPQPPYTLALAERIRLSYYERIPRARIEPVYGLLTLAHYRTSPLDLRRLLDAPQQQFYLASAEAHLLGCLWAVPEGGLTDETLITQIRRGERRPRGNLAAQMLCFQTGLEQACALRSLRISRIAVQPQWQRHGLGQRLIERLKQHAVDFLSVSFGYTPELLAFWQRCGFRLVHISESQEASSGCYSVLALCPLSDAGRALTQQAERQFNRNIAFSFHPLAPLFSSATAEWQLSAADWQRLADFADYAASLSSTLAAIRRLLAIADKADFPLLTAYCENRGEFGVSAQGKKTWLKNCRLEVKKGLQKNPDFL